MKKKVRQEQVKIMNKDIYLKIKIIKRINILKLTLYIYNTINYIYYINKAKAIILDLSKLIKFFTLTYY